MSIYCEDENSFHSVTDYFRNTIIHEVKEEELVLVSLMCTSELFNGIQFVFFVFFKTKKSKILQVLHLCCTIYCFPITNLTLSSHKLFSFKETEFKTRHLILARIRNVMLSDRMQANKTKRHRVHRLNYTVKLNEF